MAGVFGGPVEPYPLRRFAEFGILPGYEFPTEPASVRLLGDDNEEDPVTVARRFGITQFMPEAQDARTKRWRVIGLDLSSPWNPRGDETTWRYRACDISGFVFYGLKRRAIKRGIGRADRRFEPVPIL